MTKVEIRMSNDEPKNVDFSSFVLRPSFAISPSVFVIYKNL